MALKRSVLYPNSEWSSAACGGVLGLFNGRERPLKYEPESQTVKQFGMLCPDTELTAVATNSSSPSDLNGTYLYTYVEVDSKANQGQGRVSGPPKASEGASVTVADGYATLTLPSQGVNPDADEFWIYRSAAGGAWPTLGRIATISIGTMTYQDNGDTPDLANYPLDQNVNFAPAKTYPALMNRRLLLWGNEPWETTLQFAEDSTSAEYVSGDELDDGCIGAVVYPAGETEGYPIDNYIGGSPGTITLAKAFNGAIGSPGTSQIECKICHPSGQLAWSEPDDYENFPAANVRYVRMAPADPESGIAVINAAALLFTVHRTFILQFAVRPDTDGVIQELSNSIGCLAHRTIHECGGTLLWLCDNGIAASKGGPPQIISDEIAPKFDEVMRDSDGRSTKAFAVNWQAKQRYILFYPTEDDSVGCSAAIAVDYRRIPGEPQYRFTFYTFAQEFRAGGVERHAVLSGSVTTYYEYPVLVDRYGFAWSFGIGDADGPQSGTVAGTISAVSTSPPTITDGSASFDTSGLGLNGMACTIVRASDGQEQTLIVSTTAEDTLSLRDDFDWIPTSGDTYRIGQIEAYYETGHAPIGPIDRQKKLHGLVTMFEPEDSGSLTLNVYLNQSDSAESFGNESNSIDLSEADGRIFTPLSGWLANVVKVRWGNNAPNEPFKLRLATLDFETDEA